LDKRSFSLPLASPYTGPTVWIDEFGRQSIARCNLCFAGFAAAKTPALLQKLWPCRIVDRTVDSSATEQGTVGGVDYCIDFFPCNVTTFDCDFSFAFYYLRYSVERVEM